MADEPKSRADVTRAYITDRTSGHVEFRSNGTATTMTVTDASPDVQLGLAIEGAIYLRLRGARIADILDGKAIPDRVPPVGKKNSDPAVPIIVAVRAEEIFEAAKVGVGRLSPPQAREMRAAAEVQAAAEVAALTPEQIKAAKQHSEVKARIAASKGARGSLGDLFAAPAAAPEPAPEASAEMDEAAD